MTIQAPAVRDGVWQRFATNRAISPQVIQAERVIIRFFARRGYGGEVWTTVHRIQVIENEGNIEMRVEQVYRQSLQMAHFVANRCHIPSTAQYSAGLWVLRLARRTVGGSTACLLLSAVKFS